MDSKYHDVMQTKPYLPYTLGYLPESVIHQAKEELGETDKTREDALSAIRKMISEEPKFYIFTCEKYLLPYLRAQKFNAKKAFKQLVNQYQVVKQYPELFGNLKETFFQIDELWQTRCGAWQPYRDMDGCPLYIIRFRNWDPEKFSIKVILQALCIVTTFALDEEATTVTGIRCLADVQGISLKQIRQINIRYMQLIGKALRNCFPIRIKGIHVFNDSVVFKYMFGIFKLFLSEKIKNRFHFHGTNLEDVHKYIPKEILPTEYGGLNDTDSDTVWFPKLVQQYYDTIIELYQYGFES